MPLCQIWVIFFILLGMRKKIPLVFQNTEVLCPKIPFFSFQKLQFSFFQKTLFCLLWKIRFCSFCKIQFCLFHNHSFSHFKSYSFSHFANLHSFSHYAKYSQAYFTKCSFTCLQITVFCHKTKFCCFCKLQLFFFCLKRQFCSFCKVQFSRFGKYSSSRFPKNCFTCFINCSCFSCNKILSEYQWETGTLFILTFAKCTNCCPTL